MSIFSNIDEIFILSSEIGHFFQIINTVDDFADSTFSDNIACKMFVKPVNGFNFS